MATWLVSRLQNLWPFSRSKTDDLKVSDSLVRPLPVPESTKQFVFALRDPDCPSVVYLLAAENLSERSASDAECLIRAVGPKAVVAQIGPSSLDDVRAEESNLSNVEACSVPTSLFGVLKGCFLEKINWGKYESRAGYQVLQTIFGTSFHGHVLAAKQAATENHSSFLFLETPYRNARSSNSDDKIEQNSDQNGPNTSAGASLAMISQGGGLSGKMSALSGDTVSSLLTSPSRLTLAGPLHSPGLKALTSSIALSLQNSPSLDPGLSSIPTPTSCGSSAAGYDIDASDQVPSFAQSFYHLLMDLHEMFNDLPAIDKALVYARKMLADVDKGKEVDCQVLSQVHRFRIAVEGLRVALNSTARSPIKKERNDPKDVNFYELPYEEKCHVLFAQALRRQARKSDRIVAIVDASSLAGIRSYWNTPVPPEVADLAEQCFISNASETDAEEEDSESRSMLVDKPVVAVGAGAAAVVGVSSFSKIVPVSTFMKMVAFKVPALVKLGLVQTKRTAVVAAGKILSPVKILAPAAKGVMPGKLAFGSGAHAPAAMKAAATAEKLRAATHSIIASAERSSLSAMRTAFYGIMRKRKGKATGASPWVTFGGSIFVCTGLLAFGDGIEFAAESAPAAPMIARLGRGLENLRHASRVVSQMDSAQAWEAIYNSLYNVQKILGKCPYRSTSSVKALALDDFPERLKQPVNHVVGLDYAMHPIEGDEPSPGLLLHSHQYMLCGTCHTMPPIMERSGRQRDTELECLESKAHEACAYGQMDDGMVGHGGEC
eukprot:Gb_36441 [translate_table: standard]